MDIKEFNTKRFLFKGNSCLPLSPCKELKNSDASKLGSKDQIKMILSALGPQSEENLSYLASDHAFDYIKKLVDVNHKEDNDAASKTDGPNIHFLYEKFH